MPKAFCTPIDTWGTKTTGMYPFCQVVHLCCGDALFVVTICVPEKTLYGEHDETMAGLPLFHFCQAFCLSLHCNDFCIFMSCQAASEI